MTGDYKSNLRETHGSLFTCRPCGESQVEICYDGRLFATFTYVGELPEGFMDRAVHHFFDCLTGKRTALWDEQAVYGPYLKDTGETRRRAFITAEYMAAQREVKS